MYCHLQLPKNNKHSKDTTIKRKVLEVSTSSVDLTPKKKIKEELHIPTLKSTKKQSVGHKKGLTTKWVTGYVVEVKNDNILPIEKVKCEADSKPSIGELYKEGSLR